MNQISPPGRTLRVAAVGDLLLTEPPRGATSPRDIRLIDAEVSKLLAGCDLVFGNLEFTLAGDGTTVPTEPRVVGSPRHVKAIRDAGFNLVTLANNHAFDCLETGFLQVCRVLDEVGLPHFGAGMNFDQATAPLLVDRNGLRTAFLAAVDERSGPFRFATDAQSGVASLDLERLVRQVEQLRDSVDIIVVSLHWGEERFLFPAPEQIKQAQALVDAGATLVLGNHPHVIQGLERSNKSAIIYSLGNFIADTVYFADGDTLSWNETERRGCILLADFDAKELVNVTTVPTYDDGVMVRLDPTQMGRRRIAKATRALESGITLARYRRQHLWIKTVRPVLSKLRWSKLKSLRPRHFFRGLELVRRARQAR